MTFFQMLEPGVILWKIVSAFWSVRQSRHKKILKKPPMPLDGQNAVP
jgi:hypothetical protein